MKILNIHIDNFGKLSDVDIDFSNNPQIIFEDNGWGKSTLATFIKVMFYGFEGESKKRLIDKERERFKPWNKGIYGGSILLAIGEKEYELTRHFGSKEKDDTGSLVDITTKLETKEYDYTKLGEQLFSIDMDAFLRTVYLGQGNIAVHVSNEGIGDSIAAKISNLAEATDDVNNYEIVMQAFKDKMYGLKSGSKYGEINKLNAQKTELEVNVRQAQAVDNNIVELEDKLNINERRIVALEEVKNKLEHEWVLAGELGRYEEWKKNHDALVEDNVKLKVQLTDAAQAMQEDKSIAKAYDEDEIKSQLDNLDRLEECREREKELEAKIDNLQYRYDTEVRIAEEKSQREFEEATANKIKTIEAEQRQQRNKRMIGISLGVVLLLFAFALFLYAKAILAVVVGLVGCIIIDVTAINTKKKLYEKDKIAMEPIETYFVNKSQMESELNKLKDEKLKASHDAREAESFIRQFFELMEMEYSARSARQELLGMKVGQKNQLSLQEEKKKHLEAVQKAYEESCAKLEASNSSPAAKAPEHMEDIRSLEVISEERKIVDEEMEMVRKDISIYQGHIQEKKVLRDSIAEDEEQLDIIKEKIEEYERRYGIIQKTADYMSKAKEKLNSRYMNPIAEAYKRYYGYVAEDTEDYDIDANINITRKELGERRRADNLSCGYKDLVDIALRMALIDVMYDEEKPFIILDDPFVNLDTEKLEKAKAMLNKLANDYQVIYFTCHESRA